MLIFPRHRLCALHRAPDMQFEPAFHSDKPSAQETPSDRQEVSSGPGRKGGLMVVKEAAGTNKNCHCSINQNI